MPSKIRGTLIFTSAYFKPMSYKHDKGLINGPLFLDLDLRKPLT